jgi:hypothetical protein
MLVGQNKRGGEPEGDRKKEDGSKERAIETGSG